MSPIDDDYVLKTIYGYWQAKCAGRPMPARADIDPLEFEPRLLPHIVLTEAVRSGRRLRFRFRLAGTAMTEAAGLELTGQFVDALNPNKAYARYIEGLYTRAMEARRPVYSESLAMAARSSATRRTRRLMCPLSSDGETVDMFLSGQTFDETGVTGLPTLTYADSFTPGPTIVIGP